MQKSHLFGLIAVSLLTLGSVFGYLLIAFQSSGPVISETSLPSAEPSVVAKLSAHTQQPAKTTSSSPSPQPEIVEKSPAQDGVKSEPAPIDLNNNGPSELKPTALNEAAPSLPKSDLDQNKPAQPQMNPFDPQQPPAPMAPSAPIGMPVAPADQSNGQFNQQQQQQQPMMQPPAQQIPGMPQMPPMQGQFQFPPGVQNGFQGNNPNGPMFGGMGQPPNGQQDMGHMPDGFNIQMPPIDVNGQMPPSQP